MIKIGDRVKVSYFREKTEKKTGHITKSLLFARIGVVEFVFKDQAAVRFEGAQRVEQVPTVNLEKVT